MANLPIIAITDFQKAPKRNLQTKKFKFVVSHGKEVAVIVNSSFFRDLLRKSQENEHLDTIGFGMWKDSADQIDSEYKNLRKNVHYKKDGSRKTLDEFVEGILN